MMIQWVAVIIVMIPWLGTAHWRQPRASQVITQLPSELQGDRALVLEAVMKNWKALKKRDHCETVVFVCGLHEGDRDGYSMHPFVLSMAAPGLFPQWDLAFQKLNFTVTPVTYPLLEACHSEINPTVPLEHTPYITTAHEDSATCPHAPYAQLVNDCYTCHADVGLAILPCQLPR